MSLSFLCSTHREWVYYQPTQAMAFLFENQEAGELLLQQSRWHDATNFIGCALEVADIMLEQGFSNPATMLPRFTSLSIILTGIYRRTAQIENAKQVLQHCYFRLAAVAQFGLRGRSHQLCQQCIELIESQLIEDAKEELSQTQSKVH